jgi:hypothetical protein
MDVRSHLIEHRLLGSVASLIAALVHLDQKMFSFSVPLDWCCRLFVHPMMPGGQSSIDPCSELITQSFGIQVCDIARGIRMHATRTNPWCFPGYSIGRPVSLFRPANWHLAMDN